ncbi:permease-like cell division protein FtsX [Trichlorobacter ammonificans]|uniref:Cell division protein FtsX n=1 Tax=Trichlorobacter ammonificans TaxID=2916410 RepID=A0ABM9D8I0_9BACT|nr:permease-like cell division protein FtsX [Trichlorobacter ammonificans]CAH2031017.1 Cell division protein FtsX [Trichlorobacter ammonificans]
MQKKPVAKRPAMASTGAGGRFSYFVKRAVANMRQNTFVNAVTVGTITLALLIVALFLLVFVNLESAAESWSEKVQITVYFDRELAPQEQGDLKNKIMGLGGTARVAWVGKDEALKRFKGRLRGQETLLEGIRADILPASFEITLKKNSRSSEAVEAYVTRLRAIPGMGEIQYGEEWVRRFNTFLTFMRVVGALLGAFLVLAVVFIVSNTIRLTIYARRDELEVMSLVGATRMFIKMPFLLEGLLQGIAGGLMSLLLLFVTYELFLHNSGNFLTFNPVTAGLAFLPPEYCVALLLSGGMLGIVGSLTALRRFIGDLTNC